MFVNDQHSTVTLYRDKVACCLSSSSLHFITNFNLIVNAKALTVFSTYFKDVIQYSELSIQPGVRLKRVISMLVTQWNVAIDSLLSCILGLLFFFFQLPKCLSLCIYFSRYHNCNILTEVYNIESEILDAFKSQILLFS